MIVYHKGLTLPLADSGLSVSVSVCTVVVFFSAWLDSIVFFGCFNALLYKVETVCNLTVTSFAFQRQIYEFGKRYLMVQYVVGALHSSVRFTNLASVI